jgi:hypothetical protein
VFLLGMNYIFVLFRLVNGFMKHLQSVTTNSYSANTNSYTLQFTTACTVFSVCYILTDCFLLMAFSGIASSASSQLAPTLPTAVSRLSRNHTCLSLHSLGMDCIENTSPNSSSIFALNGYHMDRV